MNTGAISGYSQLNAYSAYSKTETKDTGSKANESTTAAENTSDVAAVYEKSAEAASVDAKSYTPNTELVEMLKADAEANKNSFLSMVQKTIMGQGNALASANDIWKFLASGNFTVDAATKEEAQKSIAEDGYWGVEKTSDRIMEMAKALTGGDPSKIEEMRAAFEKGFKEATKTWGQDLPDISSRTYDAVMEKFDKWAEEANQVNGVESDF